ncbi:hypothetical protein EBB59_08685 [Lysobacter pythonis]|uniref:DUF2177 family protein n=1 Tax=Solilutibacter pythonis TaxID=2483112 RepID=A0A3M2HVS4_9GAMM|nr:hypothetical protein [Lysobacter pythonis]RMH91012.1 hypothetical protein EBB59_08685 [Lysobacter pythonis]
MNKRFWICGLVMSIAAMVLDFLIHGLLLQGDYAALAEQGFVRGAEDGRRHLPWMLLAHLAIGFGLTWLYSLLHPRAGGSARDGLRFGAAMTLAASLPGYLVYYAVQPWPALLVAKQIIASGIAMLLLGLLIAWLEPRRAVL